jgi:hypothetical protein
LRVYRSSNGTDVVFSFVRARIRPCANSSVREFVRTRHQPIPVREDGWRAEVFPVLRWLCGAGRVGDVTPGNVHCGGGALSSPGGLDVVIGSDVVSFD